MIQLHPDIECTPAVIRHNLTGEAELVSKEIVDLDSIQAMPKVPAAGPVVIIDSDDDDGDDRKPFHHFQSIAFHKPPIGLLLDNLLVRSPAYLTVLVLYHLLKMCGIISELLLHV